MAKQIIILETIPNDGGRNTIKAAYWFAIAVNRRVPVANLQSAWEDASAPEIAALQDGSILEEVRTIQVATSATVAQTKAALLLDYNDRKTYLDAQPFKLQHAGVYYENNAWSA